MKKKSLTVIVPQGDNRSLYCLNSLKRQKVPVNLIVEKGPNPSKNRNSGIKRAKTPFIAFINSHTILPEDWSEKALAFFSSHKDADIVGGPQITYSQQSFFGKVSGYALASLFGAAEVSTRYRPKKLIANADERFLTSANLVCRNHVFKKVIFDESLWPGEDPKFISDSKKSGFKVFYNPDIFVYHLRRSTVRDLAKQIFSYGYTRTKKENFSNTLKKPSFLIPSIFILYLAIFPILSRISNIFLIPLALYVLLNIIFSLYESAKNHSLLALFLLPFIFFTIHIAYGLGFIYGTFEKILR